MSICFNKQVADLQRRYCTMHRLLTKVSRDVVSISTASSLNRASRHALFVPKKHVCSFLMLSVKQKRQKDFVHSDFIRKGSVGSVRTSQFASGFTPLQLKPLGSIIDVERVKDRSPEEIVSAWDDFHLGRGHIGTSMKAQLYNLLEYRAATCKYFVIPLWRGSGYTTMFTQVQMPHILFTGLEDYKARGTQAAPYFTVTHYKEFADSKDLVLVRGDIIFSSKLTDDEAKWLLETVHSFYLNDVRYKLVEQFNRETRDFEFTDVLRALDIPAI